MTASKSIIIERVLEGGSIGRLGSVRQTEEGYRFIPSAGNRKPSRKWHPTLEACLPKWTGYPTNCRVRESAASKDGGGDQKEPAPSVSNVVHLRTFHGVGNQWSGFSAACASESGTVAEMGAYGDVTCPKCLNLMKLLGIPRS